MVRAAGRSLEGSVVAVIGTHNDDQAGLAAPLVSEGATVLLCLMWSPFFDPPEQDDLAALAELCVEQPGRATLLTGVAGDSFFDLLWGESDGARRFVSWARRAFGRLDAVVLGFDTTLGWSGTDFAQQLRRTGGEVIALEGEADSSDGLVRHFASVSRRSKYSLTAMRPGDGTPRKRALSAGLGPVARALTKAGVAAHVTLSDVERVAARRRRSGDDPLAGLQWRAAGGGDHDHGGCALVTAASLAATGPLKDLEGIPWIGSGVPSLETLGLDGIVMAQHNGFADIEISPSRSRVVAIRVGTVSDAFDVDRYQVIGEWRPRDLDIIVGDIRDVLVRGEGTRLRLRRQPIWWIDGGIEGFRVWCEAARELAERGPRT